MNKHHISRHHDRNCIDNYVPEHESISNVCTPVSTFRHKLNAQRLNNPSGFNSPSIGSPLI